MGSRENCFGSVGRQNIINNHKNIDHRVKETCAIISTQVTYEIDHISLLQNSTISSALNFCFYVFYRNLKENNHIKRNTNSKKIHVYIGNQYNIIWVCRKLESAWPVQHKIKLPYLRLIGLQKLDNTNFHDLILTHVHGFCYIMFPVSTTKHLN